jgi:phosphotransferase system enzyme I (PtsP)
MAASMEPATITMDGTRIRLLANINLLRDLNLACRLKAEGVGLYRSEFPFLIRSSIPSEEEQFTVYRRLSDEMPGRMVTIRTLDLGGDKLLAYSEAARESNPDLGLKAIRFSLRHPDLFRQQLQAILRAAVDVIRVFSVYPKFLPLVQKEVAKLKIRDVELFAAELLGQSTIKGVCEVLAKGKAN